MVTEEIAIGQEIGQVKAVDDDEGENAIINYAIIDGNDNRIFGIKSGSHNEGILTVEGRLDREVSGIHLLTIKNELRFIRRSIQFSICETFKKTRSNSFSLSSVVSIKDAEP